MAIVLLCGQFLSCNDLDRSNMLIYNNSMLGGFNNNIPYQGVVFHVQTEDGGEMSPVITTLLYHKGAIYHSKQYDYSAMMDWEGYERKVKEMMQRQHDEVISALRAGEFDADVAPIIQRKEDENKLEPTSPGQLSDIIVKFIMGKRS